MSNYQSYKTFESIIELGKSSDNKLMWRGKRECTGKAPKLSLSTPVTLIENMRNNPCSTSSILFKHYFSSWWMV